MIDFKPLIWQICTKYGLDPVLLESFCWVESNMSPFAMRYEKDWKYFFEVDKNALRLAITQNTEAQLQMFSYGLGQVMGSVARELGFKNNLVTLCEPLIGLEYSAKKIKSLMIKNKTITEVVAAYNAGSARRNVEGAYVNQTYVDKVMAKYRELDGKR